MRVTLTGFKHNYGEFNGKAYDHYKLHCVDLCDSFAPEFVGKETYVLKVHTRVMEAFLESIKGKSPLGAVIELQMGLNSVVQSIYLTE